MRPHWLTREVYGNPLESWLFALAVAVGTALLVRAIKWTVRRRFEKAAEDGAAPRLTVAMKRALDHTRWFFYLMISIRLGEELLVLPARVESGIQTVAAIAILVQLGIWSQAVIQYWVEHYRASHVGAPAGASTMAAGLGFFGRLAVWTLVAILLLANLGIEVTALIAGLGIGGLAAALAVQSLAADFIAALSIYFERPFDIGDFVIVGNEVGTVERVGLRATRIRSISGEQIVVSNSELLKSRIRNMRRMQERRIVFSLGVVYSTPREKIEAIPSMIREIIESDPGLRFGRSHFKEYGDSALLFETAYWVTVPDYDTFMDAQQRINLEIHRRFEDQGIEFAFPTRTVHLVQELAPAPAQVRGGSAV